MSESVVAKESDLTQRDIAEMTQYGPEELIEDFRAEAYETTLDRWCENRVDDVEWLEEADVFEWHNAYFEVANDLDGKKFNIIPGVPVKHDSEDRDAIADLAREFVIDWLSEYVDSIKRAQARSLFSRQELRVYWALANWSRKDIKGMLDVSYPTVSGYANRAEEDIERAEATLGLVYDDG